MAEYKGSGNLYRTGRRETVSGFLHHDQPRQRRGRSGLGGDGFQEIEGSGSPRHQRSNDSRQRAAQKFVVAHMKTLKAVNPNNGMSPIQRQQKYGTSFNTTIPRTVVTPVKNWGGVEW